MKKPRMVEITWEDAHQDPSSGWKTAEEALEVNEPTFIENCGYLVTMTKTQILIAQSWQYGPDDLVERGVPQMVHLFRDIMVIPRGNVKKIRTLK